VSHALVRAAFVACFVVGTFRQAHAHDVAPAMIVFDEIAGASGFRLRIAVSDGSDARGLVIGLPSNCTRAGESVTCARPGLVGPLRVDGLLPGQTAIVRVHRVDREAATYLVPGDGIEVALGEARRSPISLPTAIRAGVEHFSVGIDHVLFVILLVLLERRPGRIAIALSAFTVAHAVTFALRSFAVVHISTRWVELLIALSVLSLALERSTRDERAVSTARAAFGFFAGLVHGLGFASALDVAQVERAASLRMIASFHVGLELAQLGVVAVVLFVLGRFRDERRERLTAIGTELAGCVAMALVIERSIAFVGS